MIIEKNILSMFIKIINPYKLGTSLKYRLKKTKYQFEKKGWSVGLFSTKNNLEQKKWNKQDAISRFTYNLKDISGFADPFLMQDNNEIFLFTESIVSNKGEIWVSTIKNNKIQKPQPVLVSSFHMSYPNVFKYMDEFYMIPETSENNSVILYKANNFPYQWSFEKTIYEGSRFVDTNFLVVDNIYYWFTYDLDLKVTRLFFSESLNESWIEHPNSKFVCNRNAGDFIEINNKILRPIQVSKETYGEGVALMLLNKITKSEFEEELYDVSFLTRKNGFALHGVHHITYLKEQNLLAIDGKNNNFYSIK